MNAPLLVHGAMFAQNKFNEFRWNIHNNTNKMPVFYCLTLKTNTMKQTAACGDGNTAGPGEDLLTFQGCWCQTISSKVLPSVDMKQITQKCPHCHMWQGKVLALRDVASSVSRTGTSKRRVTNPAGRILAELVMWCGWTGMTSGPGSNMTNPASCQDPWFPMLQLSCTQMLPMRVLFR